MLKPVKLIVLLCLLFVIFVLGSQNPHQVTLNYLIASAELPLAMIISICFAIGTLVGVLISLKLYSSLKIQNIRLKKSNQKLANQQNG